MADTLTIDASIQYTPGSSSSVPAITTGTLQLSVTLTGTGYSCGTTNIGTSEEEVVLDGGQALTTPGWTLVRNLDATNYVQIGLTTGVYNIKLLAGEYALFRMEAATDGSLFMKADTAACDVQWFCFET